MDDFKYGEFSPSIKRRNYDSRIVEMKTFPDCFGRITTDAYISAYRFRSDFKTYYDTNKTIRGFDGPCKAKYLHFDFDNEAYQDLLMDEVRKFIEKLCITNSFGIGIEDINVFFSGNKGFHIFVINDEIKNYPHGVNVPNKIKSICISVAGEYQSFDRSVYDKTRVIRLINSKHSKSGLFKIPLFLMEVFKYNFKEIRAIAKKQRKLNNEEIKKYVKENYNNGNNGHC